MLYWSLCLNLVVAGDEVICTSSVLLIDFLWIDSTLLHLTDL